MKKLILFSTIIFAGTSLFGQAANPIKGNSSTPSKPNIQKPTTDVNAAGSSNPIGKNAGNTNSNAPSKVSTGSASGVGQNGSTTKMNTPKPQQATDKVLGNTKSSSTTNKN